MTAEKARYAWRQRQDRDHPPPSLGMSAIVRAGETSGRQIPGYRVMKSGKKVPDGQIMEGIIEILTHENSAYGYEKLTWRWRRR